MSEAAVLSRDSGIPLYVQLRELLRTRILGGEWGEQDTLPTEDVLATSFRVSRATVRNALDDLVQEGLIIRRAGLGTFPRPPKMMLRMERFLSFSDDMRERGLEPTSRLLNVELTDGAILPDAVAREFGSVRLIHVATLRFADGRPVVVFDHYFPADRFQFLMSERLDASDLSFHELIVRRHGISYARADGEISAVVLSDAEADLLDCGHDRPVPTVELRTRSYDENDVLIEYSRAVVRTDRYALTFASDWRQ
jgi:DNA-binding GntR family transcriptional regulator